MVNRAIVEGGQVVNVVVGGEDGIEIAEGVDCGIGFSWDGTTFHKPQISMESYRAMKEMEIEQTRNAACYANATAHGRQWQADQRSQALLGQAITLASAGIPLPPVWRDADNNDMPIGDLTDLLEIAGAIAANVQAAYSQSWTRKAALESAQTAEEILAV